MHPQRRPYADRPMEIEIRPEPNEEERRAVELALRTEEAISDGGISRWRRAALEPDEELLGDHAPA